MNLANTTIDTSAFRASDYSDSLTDKIKFVAKSTRHIVRFLTAEELKEIDTLHNVGTDGWFVYGSRQMVAQVRKSDDKFVLWAF